MTSNDWLAVSVRYFRDMGFFSRYAKLSDDRIASKLRDFQMKGWETELDPEDELVDLSVVRADTKRVWWEDTQADVGAGNNVYVRTLKEWAGISRGAFQPTRIRENWQTERGPIWVHFSWNDAQQRIQPAYRHDYLDINILRDINSLVGASGYRFEVYEQFDESAFVVALTRTEKEKLERERGWRFMDEL